ncbi:MAG: sigma-70 family RNA polymerase sigma factor [Pseudonocardiaceae bacterium]
MSDVLEPPEAAHPPVRAATSPTTRTREADNAPALAADPVAAAEFSAFYKHSVPRLMAFLRWQGASVPDAADCVQEAMTQAHARWLTIRHPHAWCRRVASRLYAHQLASLEEPVADTDTAGSSLFAANTDWDAFEQRHEILRVLERLPLRQRQVMAWTYDGCTPTEIAEALKMTPEAVRGSLKKARTNLKAFFKEDGEMRS